jgi:biopolymer transport protein ExbB
VTARWLTLLAFGSACSFRVPGSAVDDGGGPTDVSDGSMRTAHTRLIDLADSEVIGGPHVDFPLLVALTQPWLRDAAHGGDVQSANGYDIVFSADANGQVPLAHELERYRGTTGELVAWVKLPTISPSTTLYIRYGSAAITTSQEDVPAVWTSGYAAVWHLETDVHDSAGASSGVNSGSVDGTGRIGAGRTFNGTSSFIDVGSNAAIDDVFRGGGTAEAWCYAQSFGGSSRGRVFDKGDAAGGGTTTTGWLLAVDNFNVTSSVLFAFGASTSHGEWNAPASSVSTGGWTHLAVVFAGNSSANNPLLYINGQSVAVTENPALSGTPGSDIGLGLRLGNRIAGDRAFDGTIDEARLSHVARSAGWIDTSFRNQSRPATFLSVGSEL